MFTVSKSFRFEAAHSLPHLPSTHKCHHIHGHSYEFVVHCSGDLIPELSWVVDYAEISAAVKPLVDELDHKNLNDILMTHTTAENLSFFIWSRLIRKLPSLVAVEVRETPTTNVIYRPR